MLDWLLARQRWIETSLANRHLQDATLILYDVSSSYLEGRLCPLAAFGYNRDGQKGKIRKCFGIARIALVGDRGMLTTARIRADLQPAGLDWISALTTKHLRKLAADSLVPDAVAEITSPDFLGERLGHAQLRPPSAPQRVEPDRFHRHLGPGRREAADTARVAAAVVMPGCGQSDVAGGVQSAQGLHAAGRASGRHQRLDTCQGFGIRERGGNPVLFVHALGVAQ